MVILLSVRYFCWLFNAYTDRCYTYSWDTNCKFYVLWGHGDNNPTEAEEAEDGRKEYEDPSAFPAASCLPSEKVQYLYRKQPVSFTKNRKLFSSGAQRCYAITSPPSGLWIVLATIQMYQNRYSVFRVTYYTTVLQNILFLTYDYYTMVWNNTVLCVMFRLILYSFYYLLTRVFVPILRSGIWPTDPRIGHRSGLGYHPWWTGRPDLKWQPP